MVKGMSVSIQNYKSCFQAYPFRTFSPLSKPNSFAFSVMSEDGFILCGTSVFENSEKNCEPISVFV